MSKQRTLTFSNANIETTTNYKGVPSEDMFKDDLTKLTIIVVVKSGDAGVQTEIFRNRRRFKDILFRGAAVIYNMQSHHYKVLRRQQWLFTAHF